MQAAQIKLTHNNFIISSQFLGTPIVLYTHIDARRRNEQTQSFFVTGAVKGIVHVYFKRDAECATFKSVVFGLCYHVMAGHRDDRMSVSFARQEPCGKLRRHRNHFLPSPLVPPVCVSLSSLFKPLIQLLAVSHFLCLPSSRVFGSS